jgi:5-hydroxyisourate hydrolase
MSSVSTHVLDTAHGRPAAGMRVTLESSVADGWIRRAAATTDADGRASDLLDTGVTLGPGVYHLIFETGAWFAEQRRTCFYPQVTVTFQITDSDDHYHVPLLLSPFGYSTYRGS